jgi:hypothetical protein
MDALLGKRRQDLFVPALILLIDQLASSLRDPLKLRESVEPVGGHVLRRDAAERLFAQARHADHEELVEVRAEDRQELHPLQQGIGRVLGLLEHTRVELQPAQLAVDEVLGFVNDRVGHEFVPVASNRYEQL